MKKKKMKCYIYIRVSTSMQVEGYSLEAQRERLTKFGTFRISRSSGSIVTQENPGRTLQADLNLPRC